MAAFQCTICPRGPDEKPITRYTYQTFVEHLAGADHLYNSFYKWGQSLKTRMPYEEDRFVITGLPAGNVGNFRLLELAIWISEFGQLVDILYVRNAGVCVFALQAVGIPGHSKCLEKRQSILNATEFQGYEIQVFEKKLISEAEWDQILQKKSDTRGGFNKTKQSTESARKYEKHPKSLEKGKNGVFKDRTGPSQYPSTKVSNGHRHSQTHIYGSNGGRQSESCKYEKRSREGGFNDGIKQRFNGGGNTKREGKNGTKPTIHIRSVSQKVLSPEPTPEVGGQELSPEAATEGGGLEVSPEAATEVGGQEEPATSPEAATEGGGLEVSPEAATEVGGQEEPATKVGGKEMSPKRAIEVGGQEVSPEPAIEVGGQVVSLEPATEVGRQEESPEPATEVCGQEVSPEPATEVGGLKVSPEPATKVGGQDVSPGAATEFGGQEEPATKVGGKEVSPEPATKVGGKEVSPEPAIEVGGQVVSLELAAECGRPEESPEPATEVGGQGVSPKRATEVGEQVVSPELATKIGEQVVSPELATKIGEQEVSLEPAIKVGGQEVSHEPATEVGEQEVSPEPATEVSGLKLSPEPATKRGISRSRNKSRIIVVLPDILRLKHSVS